MPLWPRIKLLFGGKLEGQMVAELRSTAESVDVDYVVQHMEFSAPTRKVI